MEENKNIVAEKVEETKDATAPKEEKAQDGKRRFNKNKKNFQRQPRKEVVKEYEERVVQINRVTKVVKGGKRMKFSALVVIGNGKGKFGFGTGKSGEVPDAIKKAVEKAKRQVVDVQTVKGNTIPHEIIGKFGATTVFLRPAPEGTGIIAGGPVRAVIELSGIKNVYSKVHGSRTKINVIRATYDALVNQKDYKAVMALRKGGEEDVK